MARRTPNPRASQGQPATDHHCAQTPGAAVRPVRLLHLADLGFRTDPTWGGAAVLAALIGRIRQDVAAGLVPDLVAITGDLAYCGKTNEYSRALTWLRDQLWPILSPTGPDGLPRDRLLLVPGNHDVDRSKVDETAEMVQEGLLTKQNQDKLAAVLGNPKQRKGLLARHDPYRTFLHHWYGQAHPLPWWQRRLVIGGQSLHLAGLDTAWMSWSDEERGRLSISRYQLGETVLPPDQDSADWRLGLMHHPWDYLAEFDQHESRSAIHLHCDLVLHSHYPEARLHCVQSPERKRTCVELAAGGIHPGDGQTPGYQWVELHTEPRAVRVRFRCWNQGQWTPDRNQSGADADGMVAITWDPVTGTDPTGARDAAPAVPAAYLDWLRRTYAGFDLLGQDTPQGSAITLSQVYVPAVTTAPAPDAAQGHVHHLRQRPATARGQIPALPAHRRQRARQPLRARRQ